jgi:hypothetical protein
MPEIKQAFLKGRMNKDLDARILPSGEYRHAQNIHISKSEGSDVGVVQNVKGNQKVGNSSIPSGFEGTVIGYYVEQETKRNSIEPYTDVSNRIFYFVKGLNNNAKDAIYYYDTSVNPIKINKNTANPTDRNFTSNPPIAIVQGSFLNFNVNNLITGVNMIDDLLFWTDDRNQPRKINVTTAIDNTSYYDNEDKISVAKYYPFSPPFVFNSADTLTGMQIAKTQEDGISLNGPSENITLANANNNIYPGQTVTWAGSPNGITVVEINGTALKISSSSINISTNTTLTFESNKDHLEEEFVRFAYRFKFIDGEYSLISPFTQHCFIPKLYNNYYTGYHQNGLTQDQLKEALKATELEPMVNDAVQVQLKINMPTATPKNDLEIDKIEILYKDSDSTAIKAVDTIDIIDYNISNTTNIIDSNGVFSYVYKSTLPYKVLTEQQLTRVYDNIPLKAKAQELTGNRLVYGNFEQNYNLPSIDFSASVGPKSNIVSTNPVQKYHIQYPYNTIKQRRTYQIGLVLSDKFGRQSSVILPTDPDKASITVDAKDNNFQSQSWNGDALRINFISQIPNAYSSSNIFGWYSWKVVVKQTEQDYYTVYAPSPYGNFPAVGGKILDGIGNLTYTADDQRMWLVLHGDNINKIPRDITNSTEEGISGSAASLYPKLVYDTSSGEWQMKNDNIYDVISIGTAKDQGIVLEGYDYSSGSAVANNKPGEVRGDIYDSTKNPLVAELVNTYSASRNNISIWETKPIESALNIYYETSTSGLVAELNAEIIEDNNGPADIKIDALYTANFDEDVNANTDIGELQAYSSAPALMSGITFTLISVFDNNGVDRTSWFDINTANNNLRVAQEKFYYNLGTTEYYVEVQAEDGNSNTYTNTNNKLTITLNNVAPFFTNLPASTTLVHFRTYNFFDVNAENGSHDNTTPQDTLDLEFSITSVTKGGVTQSSHPFSINSSTGMLSNSSAFPSSDIGDTYRINIQVSDNVNSANPLTATGYVDVEIVPQGTSSYLWGNFSTICTTTNSQQFFIVRDVPTNASQSTSFTDTDLVYTSYSNGTLSGSFGGYIIIGISGNNRTYVDVGGGTNEVQGTFTIDCSQQQGP